MVHVLPLGIKELDITRGGGWEFKDPRVDAWTVTDMADQVVELVESRQLVQLTVSTGIEGEVAGVNAHEAEVMARLEAAYDVTGVVVQRIVVESVNTG